ncbi:hypothetical protein DQ04_07461020 [Trypanosoma grayi]|uniref:hypothetical protein n=1 Tax=Trypanosoma grayi TaxID=71804 RepID=UPI0004F456CF|nr:hypothetical protein DQ04_07461020 [Trypanosoma grayi]KEG08318.1 hypothetical protein DQ04_07461020 [Trypanosoma grayi]
MKPEIMLSCDTALERQHESHADSATRGTSKTVSAPTLIPEGECHAMLLKIKEQRRIAEYALSSLEKGERQNMGSLPAVMSGDKEESFRATIDAHILDDIKQEAANIHPAYNRDEDDNYPNHFCCPITMKPLCRPVVVKASGRTYEMDAIVAWLTKNSVEPMTQHTLEGPIESLYVFNYALKESMDFFDEYKRKRIVARRRALVDATIRDMFIFSRENNQRSYTAMVENVAEREYLKQIIQNYKDEEHRLGFSCILGITD